jgi:hypothetical protein
MEFGCGHCYGLVGAHNAQLLEYSCTRVLKYKIPADAEAIADLCGAILAIVHGVAPADEVLICDK